jgi:ring-1,2-phenylacetyl-CoA epoxidase subunit PaaE
LSIFKNKRIKELSKFEKLFNFEKLFKATIIQMIEFGKQYLQGAASMLSILSILFVIFWVFLGKRFGNRKVQLSKRAGWPQIKDEIITALIATIGSTLFAMLLVSMKDAGTLKFYPGSAGAFSGYEVITVIVMLLISDTWFYWSHRAMHHPSIYKYVHALHHRSLDVNPYTSLSFHVIEAVWLTLWMLPLALFMPISMKALGVMQVIGLFNNVKSHLGYEFFPGFFKNAPFNMLVTATNHSLHHTQYNGNYGLFFRFWDIVCDTELKTTITLFNDIHHREDAKIVDNSSYRPLPIDKLHKENDNTVSVYFKPSDPQFYQYEAGQYLTLKVKVDGKTYDRCFSLSSSPKIDDFLRITVKLKGEVSHYFYNTAKVGDVIEALLPVGDFIAKPNPNSEKNYVMIAGGSGITPLYSMIRQILNHEPRSKVTLLYANSSENNIIFKNEITQLATDFQGKFQSIDFISGKRRISKEDLQFEQNTNFYICGPDALKEGIKAHLKTLNIDPANINVEHFADGYVPWFGLLNKKRA